MSPRPNISPSDLNTIETLAVRFAEARDPETRGLITRELERSGLSEDACRID